jgi:hypothetical protein
MFPNRKTSYTICKITQVPLDESPPDETRSLELILAGTSLYYKISPQESCVCRPGSVA